LKDVLSSSDFAVTPDTIKKRVCTYFNIKIADLESSKRTKNLAYPRQIAMYFCRNITDMPYAKIGESFGGRDHSTVLHACEKISTDMKTDDSLKTIIKTIEKELTGNY